MKPLKLTFFVELDEAPFVELTRRAEVREALLALGAGVTVGLRDLGPERATAMRELSDAGIPVGAWLLLPEHQGYFATYDNVAAVTDRLVALRRWVAEHRLRPGALGLDFEPDLRELRLFFDAPVASLATWLTRSRDLARWRTAKVAYQALIDELRAEGWSIDAYQFPFVLEDRAAHGSFLQRVSGGLDVRVDREIVMAYSSLLGPLGPGLVAGWAPRAQAVAVGSTGGGIDPLPKLSWEAFERDLLVAARVCPDVHVFSLEGCVEHGYLERLRSLDWEREPSLPAVQRGAAAAARGLARLVARL